VTLQTVGAYGSAPHPTWVSYLIKDPSTGQWVHTSYFQVPAHTRVNMTIIQYDSGSPLRNQQIGMVTGTAGKVALLNGKPFHVYNSNAGNGVGTPSPSRPSDQRAAGGQQRQREPVQCGALHREVAAQRAQVLLHIAGLGLVPLAMLRPLRTGLLVRQRWTDADQRLHGRLHEGGGMSVAAEGER